MSGVAAGRRRTARTVHSRFGLARARLRGPLREAGARLLDQREPELVADRVVGPDFRDRDRQVAAQPAGAVDGRGRHVQVELRPQFTEGHPLRHRLEVVDRLGGLHLDDAHDLAAALLQDEVRIPGRRSRPDGGRLFVADVDGDVELSLVLRLQQANDPIVLELLADRPHEDGAQYNLRREGLDDATTANIPESAREYSTSPAGIPGI